MGVAITRHFLDEGYRVLTVAVGKVHAHGLVELPEDLRRVKAIVGNAKRKSSRAVKKELPGNVWAAGGTYKRVQTSGHLEGAFGYILYDQGPEAWTWSFRDRSGEGMFGRKRPAKAKRQVYSAGG